MLCSRSLPVPRVRRRRRARRSRRQTKQRVATVEACAETATKLEKLGIAHRPEPLDERLDAPAKPGVGHWFLSSGKRAEGVTIFPPRGTTERANGLLLTGEE